MFPIASSRTVSTRSKLCCARDVTEHLVVLVDHVRVPELPDRGLRGSASRACRSSERLHFVQRRRILGARQGWWSGSPELRRALEDERAHRSDPRCLGRLSGRQRSKHPRARSLGSDAERRSHRCIAAVAPARRDQIGGRSGPNRHTRLLGGRRQSLQRDVEVVGVGALSATPPAPGSSTTASCTPPLRPQHAETHPEP